MEIESEYIYDINLFRWNKNTYMKPEEGIKQILFIKVKNPIPEVSS